MGQRQATWLQALVGSLMFAGVMLLLFAVLSRWGTYLFVLASIVTVGTFVLPTFLRVSTGIAITGRRLALFSFAITSGMLATECGIATWIHVMFMGAVIIVIYLALRIHSRRPFEHGKESQRRS